MPTDSYYIVSYIFLLAIHLGILQRYVSASPMGKPVTQLLHLRNNAYSDIKMFPKGNMMAKNSENTNTNICNTSTN